MPHSSVAPRGGSRKAYGGDLHTVAKRRGAATDAAAIDDAVLDIEGRSRDLAGLSRASPAGFRRGLQAMLRQAAVQHLTNWLHVIATEKLQFGLLRWRRNAQLEDWTLRRARVAEKEQRGKESLRAEQVAEVAELRRAWRSAREAHVSAMGRGHKDGIELPLADVQKLKRLDGRFRGRLDELQHDNAEALQNFERTCQKLHTENQVSFLAIVLSTASKPKPAAWADVEVDVGFLQWAFTRPPEQLMVPFQRAIELDEQRRPLETTTRRILKLSEELSRLADLGVAGQPDVVARERARLLGARLLKSTFRRCSARSLRGAFKQLLKRRKERASYPVVRRSSDFGCSALYGGIPSSAGLASAYPTLVPNSNSHSAGYGGLTAYSGGARASLMDRPSHVDLTESVEPAPLARRRSSASHEMSGGAVVRSGGAPSPATFSWTAGSAVQERTPDDALVSTDACERRLLSSSSCGTCGSSMVPGAKFCATCGAPDRSLSSSPCPTGGDCGACGAAMPSDAQFCAACGAAGGVSSLVMSAEPSPTVPSLASSSQAHGMYSTYSSAPQQVNGLNTVARQSVFFRERVSEMEAHHDASVLQQQHQQNVGNNYSVGSDVGHPHYNSNEGGQAHSRSRQSFMLGDPTDPEEFE